VAPRRRGGTTLTSSTNSPARRRPAPNPSSKFVKPEAPRRIGETLPLVSARWLRADAFAWHDARTFDRLTSSPATPPQSVQQTRQAKGFLHEESVRPTAREHHVAQRRRRCAARRAHRRRTHVLPVDPAAIRPANPSSQRFLHEESVRPHRRYSTPCLIGPCTPNSSGIAPCSALLGRVYRCESVVDQRSQCLAHAVMSRPSNAALSLPLLYGWRRMHHGEGPSTFTRQWTRALGGGRESSRSTWPSCQAIT
jgi:hypothetical protein